jgi:hypothetical protein
MLQTVWPLESSGAFSDRTELHPKKKEKRFDFISILIEIEISRSGQFGTRGYLLRPI